jgi:hypothetical protein
MAIIWVLTFGAYFKIQNWPFAWPFLLAAIVLGLVLLIRGGYPGLKDFLDS